MSFLGSDQAPMPQLPSVETEATARPVLGVQGKRPGKKSAFSTFLGAEAVPSGGTFGKTLLGM